MLNGSLEFPVSLKVKYPVKLNIRKRSASKKHRKISLTDIVENNNEIRLNSPSAKSADNHRREKIEQILHSKQITNEEIAKLFLVPFNISIPWIKLISVESYRLHKDMTNFTFHPVASNENSTVKYNNINK